MTGGLRRLQGVVLSLVTLAAAGCGPDVETLCGTPDATFVRPGQHVGDASDPEEPAPAITGSIAIVATTMDGTTVFPPLDRWNLTASAFPVPGGYDVRVDGEVRCISTLEEPPPGETEPEPFVSWVFDAGVALEGPVDAPTSVTPASAIARPGAIFAAREARQSQGWLALSTGVGEVTVERFDPAGVLTLSGWVGTDGSLGQEGELAIDLDLQFEGVP